MSSDFSSVKVLKPRHFAIRIVLDNDNQLNHLKLYEIKSTLV